MPGLADIGRIRQLIEQQQASAPVPTPTPEPPKQVGPTKIGWRPQPQPPAADDWFKDNAPPAATTPAPTAPAGGGNQNWDEGSFAAQFGRPGTPQELLALEGKLGESGIKVLRNAAGVAGKIQLPNGQIVDIINSAGAGGKGFQWLAGDGGSGGGGTTLGGGFGTGEFAQGFGQTFQSPSIEEMRAMPGYQFALQEGLKAGDTGAAAKGTLLTGGHEKDRIAYATGLADQTGQQKYLNALGEYKTAYDIFRNDHNDVFDRFDRIATRGTNAANSATA